MPEDGQSPGRGLLPRSEFRTPGSESAHFALGKQKRAVDLNGSLVGEARGVTCRQLLCGRDWILVGLLLRHLDKDRKPTVLYIVVGLLAGLVGLLLLGSDAIVGVGAYWETAHDDSVQSVAGIRYYLQEGWGIPLLKVEGYGYPEGASLFLTDSIPLAALFAKLVRGFLPAGWHYLGYWLLLCFILQAVSMVALLRSLGWRSHLSAAFGLGFALSQFVFLDRYVHAALMAHFLLIFALAAYVNLRRGERLGAGLARLAALVALSILVHPYLFVMVLVISTIAVVQVAVDRTINWWVGTVWLMGTSVLVLGIMAVSGLLSAALSPASGFGFYSLNLLSPIVPQRSGLFPGLQSTIDATGGQNEGFSYLGFGVLGLLVIHLVWSREMLASFLRRNSILFVGLLLMAVYALSNVVYVGGTLLVRLSIPAPILWLTEQFRSSGRFVWPLSYAIVATVLIGTYRRFGVRVATLILASALSLQVVDAAQMYRNLESAFRLEHDQQLDTGSWTTLIGAHDLVRMPAHQCLDTRELLDASLEVQRIAADLGTAVTAAATARRVVNCEDPAFLKDLTPGELRVAWDRGVEPPDSSTICRQFSLGLVCSHQASLLEEFGLTEND